METFVCVVLIVFVLCGIGFGLYHLDREQKQPEAKRRHAVERRRRLQLKQAVMRQEMARVEEDLAEAVAEEERLDGDVQREDEPVSEKKPNQLTKGAKYGPTTER